MDCGINIKAAIVGGGFIGKQHIESIRRIPYARPIAVCESNIKAAQEIANIFGIEFYYDSVEKMLKQHPDLDVVHNCSPSHLHYPINKQILQANINVFSEKPFTLHSYESEELAELAKKSGLIGGVSFNYRHNAMVAEMRERVKNKSIGNVWFVATEYLQDWLLFNTDYNWRVEETYGGNTRAISDIGSHCFDTIQYIIGRKIVSVLARRSKLHTERLCNGKAIAVDNEDAAIIHARFECGTESIIRVSQLVSGRKNDFRILIEGTEQSLEWYQEKPDRLKIGNRDKGNIEIFADAKYLTGKAKEKIALPNGHAVGWADAFTNSVRSFYDAIRGKESDYSTFEDAHHIMKITDACVESDKLNAWVDI
ncbi:MAG: Gfo/Idh/MocA family oxidoreductase [Defluviitaleaceae bacterium]|nr:Gfo/Idh/MocA family oxidoreductase [Defluviitaleaceae bacterium]